MSKKRKWLLLLVGIIMLLIWIVWGNSALELNEYYIKSDKIPEAFSGFRIVHISDFHNAEIGEDNVKLIRMIEQAEPDIIVITGDIIDSYRTDIDVSLQFIEKVVQIAPCYYVTGNHEARFSKEVYSDFEKKMEYYGVNVLHNKIVFLERDEMYICLGGLDDPTFAQRYSKKVQNKISDQITELFAEEGYKILLSHRPDFYQDYVKADVDLVFSGHAHGGQVRIPLIGGIVAPNQGFFPEYDAGLFVEENTQMFVSRGIGNSLCPIRFNNRPEVIVVELTK